MTARNLRPSQPGALGDAFKRIRILEAVVTAPLPTTERELLTTPGSTNIGNGFNADLPWAYLQGDVLLDLSTPTLPTVIEAGIYAVTLGVQGSALTVGGIYQVIFWMDQTGDSAMVVASSPPSVTADPDPEVTVAMTYYVPAGGILEVAVVNGDGVAARDFNLNSAVVQRIT